MWLGVSVSVQPTWPANAVAKSSMAEVTVRVAREVMGYRRLVTIAAKSDFASGF
jgi:hypothetical protein